MTKWISRASVMRIIDADPVYSDVINEKTYMASQINELPTKEETSRPHGEWIDTGYGTSRCSVCGEKCQTYRMDKPRDRYCLWCGADMRKRGEAE